MFLIAFLTLYGIGFFITHFFLPEIKLLEKLGLAFGIGLGFVTLLIFVLLLFHQFTPGHLLIILISIFLFLAFVYLKKGPLIRFFPDSNASSSKYSAIQLSTGFIILILGLVFFLVLSSFVFSSFFPVMETDGTNYVSLGRVIAHTQELYYPESLHQKSLQRTLLIPLSYTFIESFQGPLIKLVHPLFYGSFLLVFYHRLKDLDLNKPSALILTGILAATPIIWWHSTLSFNNLATGYYFAIGTFFLFSGILNKSKNIEPCILFAGIFYALAVWTRLEFLVFFAIPLLILQHHSIKTLQFRLPFYLALPPICLGLFWSIFLHILFPGSLKFSLSDIWVLLILIFLLALYTLLYTYATMDEPNTSRPGWVNELVRLKNNLTGFVSRHWPAVLGILFILLFVVGEFKILDSIFPRVSYYLISVESRFFQTLMQHSYWIFTNFLVVLFFIKGAHQERALRYIFFFLLSLIVVHNLVYIIMGPGKMFGRGMIEIIQRHIFLPGNYLNGSSSRELISFYPIVIFGAGLAYQRMSTEGGVKNKVWVRLNILLKFILALNLLVLFIVFFHSKATFMMEHFGKTKREILLSGGSRDNPNNFVTANQWSFRVKDLTPENAVIIIPKEHSLGMFTMLNILTPRKTLWFKENTNPEPSIYFNHGDRPVYAITAGGWKPAVPFESIETFTHKEFEVSLVKIIFP